MQRLIKMELYKIYKERGTRICFLGLLIIMLILTATEYMDVREYNRNQEYQNEVISWEEREQTLIKYATESLEDDYYSPLQKEQIRRRIEIAKYRIENDIPKDIYKNVWWFFNDSSFSVISLLVIAGIVWIGSSAVASEYQKHTIRPMLLLPYRRFRILLSKYIATGIAGALLYGLVFILGLLSGLILHGVEGMNSQVVLYFGGNLVTMNMSLYSLLIILLKAVEILFYAAVTVFLAVCTKNVAATCIVGGALGVFGVPILSFMAGYYPFIRYLPFLNVNFRRYLDFGTTMPVLEQFFQNDVVAGITPVYSAIIVLLTIAAAFFISLWTFERQEL